MPLEIRENLIENKVFREHFEREIEMLGQEKEFRARAQTLLKQYYHNFDVSELSDFLSKEVKEKRW